MTGALCACGAFDYREADLPVAQTAVSRVEPVPCFAVVLGSGGPRGYAHIGAMRVFEEAGMVPDLIVGSSVGSLIAALWASGISFKDIETRSIEGGPTTLFDFNPFADRGWIRGERLQNYVDDAAGARPLEQLPRPVIIVATRRDTKAPAFFQRGNVGVAVRASSAMPRIFSPVGIAGTDYEDADESLPLAVRAARQAGARFVLAIDVSAKPSSVPPDAPSAVRAKEAARRSRIEPEAVATDLLLHPNLDYNAGPRRAYFDHARLRGETEARGALRELRRALEAKCPMQPAARW